MRTSETQNPELLWGLRGGGGKHWGSGDSDAYIAGMRAVWARLEPFTKGFYVNSRYEDDVKACRENYGDIVRASWGSRSSTIPSTCSA